MPDHLDQVEHAIVDELRRKLLRICGGDEFPEQRRLCGRCHGDRTDEAGRPCAACFQRGYTSCYSRIATSLYLLCRRRLQQGHQPFTSLSEVYDPDCKDCNTIRRLGIIPPSLPVYRIQNTQDLPWEGRHERLAAAIEGSSTQRSVILTCHDLYMTRKYFAPNYAIDWSKVSFRHITLQSLNEHQAEMFRRGAIYSPDQLRRGVQ